MSPVDYHIIRSGVRPRNTPTLSVLIPYYHDDPTEALSALTAQIKDRSDTEVLIWNDGTDDANLNAKVAAAVKAAPAAVTFFSAHDNHGRSFARNQLTAQARAETVLFLDADMRPENKTFIADYIALIEADTADIIFGGFTVPDTSDDPERELHRAFSETSDCLSLSERQAKGPQYVASSNLCVKKSVLAAEPFDPDFTGWGWEDSEWAARAADRFTLLHADNPALHYGLETTDTLLRRFQTSGENYRRFTDKHPQLADTLTLYQVIGRLKTLPGHSLLRPLLRVMVKARALPIKLRLGALKLWRASWYTEAF